MIFNFFKKNKNNEKISESNELENDIQIEQNTDLENNENTNEEIKENENFETQEEKQEEKETKETYNEYNINNENEKTDTLENFEEEKSIEENINNKKSFFEKIKSGLSKTRNNILNGVEQVLKNFKSVDEELFEELEEALIMADIGVNTSGEIINRVKEISKKEKIIDSSEIKQVIIRVISEMLESETDEFELKSPAVILVIGVNGVGKTTTIGKLTYNFKRDNKNVLIAAADTFRAAAIDQLQVWGDRTKTDVIKHQENSDPAAVVFDAVKAAKARKSDILICDTAGRLHNKKNLMEELKKISRIIEREYNDAKIETFLILDATTGQNALQQAKLFKEATNITGIIMTKLDGTAKGGIVIAIKNELKIPVRYIGVGEGIEDLQKFNSKEFSKALFEDSKL